MLDSGTEGREKKAGYEMEDNEMGTRRGCGCGLVLVAVGSVGRVSGKVLCKGSEEVSYPFSPFI